MFGNIMNNKQICEAINTGCIKISGFDSESLRNIHYPLTPGKFLRKKPEGPDGQPKLSIIRDCMSDNDDPYWIQPNEFVVVQVAENISLKEAIIGHFASTSNMAKKGISLIAGRIEAPFGDYGQKKQNLQFGIKNNTDAPVLISEKEPICYIYFVDLRGLDKQAYILTSEEVKKFRQWSINYSRAETGGVNYEDGS
jgi:deoxycytidine triphosphate deaminase